MEIQLDPRGVRIKTASGWQTFTPQDTVESLISAIVMDRNHGSFIPGNGLGAMPTMATSIADAGGPDHIQGTAAGKWRKVPNDPRLRRVLASAKLRRQAVGMTLDELLA